MSEYGFGYYDGDAQPGEPQAPAEAQAAEQGPKWFREGLAKLSTQVNELKAENDRLKAERTRGQIQDSFKAAGYDPGAAALYTGEPGKVNDWLQENGRLLAKLPSGEGEQEQEPVTPQGVPQTVVSPESQAQLARMQAMGAEGVAAPVGSDRELASQIDAADSEDALDALLRAHGNRFV